MKIYSYNFTALTKIKVYFITTLSITKGLNLIIFFCTDLTSNKQINFFTL